MIEDEKEQNAYHRVYAEIDLNAIGANMEAMKEHLPQNTKIIGVVKADGYGHGAVPVARAIGPYVAGYAAATAQEAVILRRHGIEKPILILGPVHQSLYELLISEDIRPTLFTQKEIERFHETAQRMGKRAAIHLALDTGMSRIGMVPDEASADMVREMAKLPWIVLEGIFTHFATADERNKEKTKEQLARYRHFLALLEERGIEIPVKHCANSAGIIEALGTDFPWVRAGISIYGLYPSQEVDTERVKLHPALTLKSYLTYVKTIEPGTEVSYGGTYRAQTRRRIATVPVGYGDGYPRNLSGKGWVLIRGERAPILGRVCMDQFMVDVTSIDGVRDGDEVVLIGRDGKEEVTVEDLARAGGGFSYEMICNLGKRIPRMYLSRGKVVGKKDYFEDEYLDFLGYSSCLD